MSLKIKALLQIIAMTSIGLAVGLGIAIYNRLVGDANTLYTIAALCMAFMFYSMYKLLLDRLEYEEEVKRISERIEKITKK